MIPVLPLHKCIAPLIDISDATGRASSSTEHVRGACRVAVVLLVRWKALAVGREMQLLRQSMYVRPSRHWHGVAVVRRRCTSNSNGAHSARSHLILSRSDWLTAIYSISLLLLHPLAYQPPTRSHPLSRPHYRLFPSIHTSINLIPPHNPHSTPHPSHHSLTVLLPPLIQPRVPRLFSRLVPCVCCVLECVCCVHSD